MHPTPLLAATLLAAVTLPSQDPSNLPGMRLWLRADAGVQTASGAVVQWNDQSGAGNHVTQATTGLRPTLAPNVVNGLPAVRFDGSDRLVGSLGGTWTAGSVFALVQYTVASSANDYLYAIGLPGSSGSQMTLSRTNGDDAYHYDGALAVSPTWTALPASQFLVVSQTYGEGGADRHLLREGGHWILPSRATAGYSVNAGSFALGNWSSGSYGLIGDVVEFLVFDRVLAPVERGQVDDYLRRRAALPAQQPDATLDPSTWAHVQYEFLQQPDADWSPRNRGAEVHQPVNSDASVLLSDFDARGLEIRGSFSSTSGPDFVGFVFGWQDRGHFYVFDWREDPANWCSAVGQAGMRLRAFDVPGALDPTCAQFWSRVDLPNVTTLASNSIPRVNGPTYGYRLVWQPPQIAIEVTQGSTVLQSWNVSDGRFGNGRFGLFVNSQQTVTFARPTASVAAPIGTVYGAGCTGAGDHVPTVRVTGSPTANGALTFHTTNALGGALAIHAIGVGQSSVPLPNGCVASIFPLIDLFGPVIVGGAMAASGIAQWSLPLPSNAPVGFLLTVQPVVLDPTKPLGIVLGNAVAVITQ